MPFKNHRRKDLVLKKSNLPIKRDLLEKDDSIDRIWHADLPIQPRVARDQRQDND
jgi:hypothetical protein